jgi:hypothetical protein
VFLLSSFVRPIPDSQWVAENHGAAIEVMAFGVLNQVLPIILQERVTGL